MRYLVGIEANDMGRGGARGAAARAKEIVAAIQADEEHWTFHERPLLLTRLAPSDSRLPSLRTVAAGRIRSSRSQFSYGQG